ncbi:MAG TPA: glycosyltransferase [Gemmataceae bacterium]|nr:glycosyltransferase [Gemmataceae bacterium]
MSGFEPLRVGYVVKRYPRYSETFIVREILAHEEAGMEVEIYSLRPPNDGHFQDLLARVKARVNYMYLPDEALLPEALVSAALAANHLWRAIQLAAQELPGIWRKFEAVQDEQARPIYQALHLARDAKAKGIHHLHAPFASDAATVARLAAHFGDLSYSITARAKDIFHCDVRDEDLRRKLRDAAGVVTISDYHLDYLRKKYGPLAAHVQRIYNGLNLEEYPFHSPENRAPIILGVGRLVEKKGFAHLIEACEILAKRELPFRCRIVGGGKLKPELQAQIDCRQLTGAVELLGPLPQNEVIQEMKQAALLAMPCIIAPDGDRDGLPNVIQEALALGTPVVTTDVTGIPEVVRHNETGLLVPQQDSKALADACQRLLQNADLRVGLARKARLMMERDFDIRRTTHQRRMIFRSAIPNRVKVVSEAS